MTLFLAHTAILLGSSYGAAHGLFRSIISRILSAALLAWANIVVTSLLLASLHRLGEPAWFFRTSLMLALLTWLVFRKVHPEPLTEPREAGDGRPNLWLLFGFIVTLAPIVYAGIRIACVYVPNNYDSLAYHFPRAMYYLGQNSLAHFDTGNPRQIYFPLNYNLLQLFALIYSPPLQCLNLFNLASWAVAGLALFRLCRLCALGANAALIATWLALTSTQVIAQGTATTNDLPTAAGLLCTLVFVLRWNETRRTRDALLAGLAAGLAAGTKLTVIFFAPVAGIIVLGLAYGHWRRAELRQFFAGVRAWILPGLLALGLASPFAVINLAEKGEWINHTYDFTLNRPFSIASVIQTSEAYLVQLFIEPLHRFTFDLKFTDQLNTWGKETFFPHWNEAYAFSPLYLFPPDLNEDHVWFGFAGPFILLCAMVCLVRFRSLRLPLGWFAWLGLGWFITYFLLNKWSLYNQRYFVPAILVMAPCVAVVVEAGWNSVFRRGTRLLLTLLACSSLWLAGVYLFNNTSRPYAPLWAGDPVPQALPTLPPLMVQRLASQERINIDSTDGNERIFLLMALGKHQRFTSFGRVNPNYYNVFSEWGFPRKVAYSNIEQRSSYTIVDIPTKRTAGVEYLGTLGTGQPAIDYYGLLPHANDIPSAEGNRTVLVAINYGPHEPDRYKYMLIKVAGLNSADEAKLDFGVEYNDGTTEHLAAFTETGQAPAPVTRPFRRFTIRVEDKKTGQQIGAIDIPYLFRDKPADDDTPYNPSALFTDELVDSKPKSKIATTGLGEAEGPYAQWNLPLVRWATDPVARLDIPGSTELSRLDVTFSLRPQAREAAHLDVVFNGELVQSYDLLTRTEWLDQTLSLKPRPGNNVLEFRNVSAEVEADWLDYVERYPDIRAYLTSHNIPLEAGGKEHWMQFGRNETRIIHLNPRHLETIPSVPPLYFVFRRLSVEGYK